MVAFPLLEYTIAFVALYASVFFFLLLYKHRNELDEEPALLPKNKLQLVSIVIPVLNEAGTITKTLDSVFALNYPKNKLEVIVVDDGSTDNTVHEVKNYGRGLKIFARIQLLCGNIHVNITTQASIRVG